MGRHNGIFAPLHQEVWGHPKTIRAARVVSETCGFPVGFARVSVVAAIHRLTCWAFARGDTGSIADLTDFDLAREAAPELMMEGPPSGCEVGKVLRSALREAGFIESVDGDERIHDFQEHMAKALASRRNGSRGGRPRKNPQDNPQVSSRLPLAKTQEEEEELKKTPTPLKKGGVTKAQVSSFQDLWNQHRGEQPLCRVVGKEREKLIKRALVTTSDMDLHAAAIRAFAANDFARANNHTIDTYCRHHEKWLDAGGEPSSTDRALDDLYGEPEPPLNGKNAADHIFDRIREAQGGGA
jgi:hypothetical protein